MARTTSSKASTAAAADSTKPVKARATVAVKIKSTASAAAAAKPKKTSKKQEDGADTSASQRSTTAPAAASNGAAASAAAPALTKTAQRMFELLNEGQHSYATHKKIVTQASATFNKFLAAYNEKNSSSSSSELTSAQQQRHLEKAIHKFLVLSIYPALFKLLAVSFKREPTVERSISLMSDLLLNFSSDQRHNDLILVQVCYVLIGKIECKDKAIRYRCCQLIGNLFSGIAENAEVDEALFENLIQVLLLRTDDKIPLIRAEAVRALIRFQVSSSDINEQQQCPVINKFMMLLTFDSSSMVRQAVLNAIAVNKVTIRAILLRIRDTSPAVRKAAIQVLGSRVELQHLSIKQRVSLLSTILHDRDTGVQQAAVSLLITYIQRCCNNSVLDLLKQLDVEEWSSECQIIVQMYVRYSVLNEYTAIKPIQWKGAKSESGELDKDQPLATPTLLPPYTQQQISVETAYYWRYWCETLHGHSDASVREKLDLYLSDTVELCTLIEYCIQQQAAASQGDTSSNDANHWIFMIQQLLKLCTYVDLTDEHGRRILTQLLNEQILTTVNSNHSLVSIAIQLLKTLFKLDESHFINAVLEVISEVRDPLETSSESEVLAAQLQRDLQQRIDETEQQRSLAEAQKLVAMENELFAQAEAAKQEEQQLRQLGEQLQHELQTTVYADDTRYIRMLTITSCLLEHIHRFNAQSHAGLAALLENTIHPAIMGHRGAASAEIRLLGIQCLGLYCLLDRQTAEKSLILFLQVMSVDFPALRVVALQCVCDILMMYENLIPMHAEAKEVDAEGEEADDAVAATDISVETILAALLNLLDLLNISNGAAYELDADTTDLAVAAVETLCKLLIYDRITSSVPLLQQLLLIQYHPNTRKYPAVNQRLAIFWPNYMVSDQFTATPNHHLQLYTAAYVPLVMHILQHKEETVIGSINVNTITQNYNFVLEQYQNKLIQVGSKAKSQANTVLPTQQLATQIVLFLQTVHGTYPRAGKHAINHQTIYRTLLTAVAAVPLVPTVEVKTGVLRQTAATLDALQTELQELIDSEVVVEKNAAKALEKFTERMQTVISAVASQVEEDEVNAAKQESEQVGSEQADVAEDMPVADSTTAMADYVRHAKSLQRSAADNDEVDEGTRLLMTARKTAKKLQPHTTALKQVAAIPFDTEEAATDERNSLNISVSDAESDEAYEEDRQSDDDTPSKKRSKVKGKSQTNKRHQSSIDFNNALNSDEDIASLISPHKQPSRKKANTTQKTPAQIAAAKQRKLDRESDVDTSASEPEEEEEEPASPAAQEVVLKRQTSARKTKQAAREKLTSQLNAVDEDASGEDEADDKEDAEDAAAASGEDDSDAENEADRSNTQPTGKATGKAAAAAKRGGSKKASKA